MACISITEKRCSLCQTIKPASAYHRDSRGADGIRSHCKECRNAANRRPRVPPTAIAGEVWRPVVNYEGSYEVSNFGNVRRIKQTKGCLAGTLLKPNTSKIYPRVFLCVNQRRHTHFVHRLVMSAFVGPCPQGHEVNHIDGNKPNSRLENLEYVTPKENMKHASLTGLLPKGTRHFSFLHPEKVVRGEQRGSKLKEEEIKAIRQRFDAGESLSVIAESYGVHKEHIRNIGKRKTWRHVE